MGYEHGSKGPSGLGESPAAAGTASPAATGSNHGCVGLIGLDGGKMSGIGVGAAGGEGGTPGTRFGWAMAPGGLGFGIARWRQVC